MNRVIVPFLACGDLSAYDSDKTYDLNINNGAQYVPLPPVQAPINPPYQTACYLKKNNLLATSGNPSEDRNGDKSLISTEKGIRGKNERDDQPVISQDEEVLDTNKYDGKPSLLRSSSTQHKDLFNDTNDSENSKSDMATALNTCV